MPLPLIPGLEIPADSPGLVQLPASTCGTFVTGKHGVDSVVSTGDLKVEFISMENRCLAHVRSAMGYPAYYPVPRVRLEHPLKAVLMDLDGTSVRSEHFWIWIIEQTIGSLLGNPKFQLEESDLPHVSGHSVSEHLQYGIAKYAPGAALETAREWYFRHTHREMREILEGRGKADAFTPSPGLKEFLYELKDRKVKIGLVTSGLYEKAYPEIVSAFQTLNMGDPLEFYDAIITAGHPMRKGGETGTLGELSPKPHPWLYAETARVGLGIPFEERHHIVGIEDSGAGICSIRLAGFSAIGFAGGNIDESGTRSLCNFYCEDFAEVFVALTEDGSKARESQGGGQVS